MIIIKPYRQDKDLGKAYNETMQMIPENGHACLMDIDTMFLTPQQPGIILQYIEKYPNAVLTCYTNRISPISKQLYHGQVNNNPDVLVHINTATKMQLQPLKVRMIGNAISGFLMVIPKSVWNKFKFIEGIGCLGVDTWFSRECHRRRIPILLMETLYVFHIYRIENGIYDRSHLKLPI